MMNRTEAFEYLKARYRVDDMDDLEFNECMRKLMNTPHKPYCRTKLAALFPNYGADCTCGES
jgi:hypothetical protein